jgi:hypothetical protein
MITKREHEVAYQDVCALVNKHADKLTSLELLAVAANMIGKLVALQDQRKVTPKKAMEVVAKNLELGNAQVLEQLSASQGRS